MQDDLAKERQTHLSTADQLGKMEEVVGERDSEIDRLKQVVVETEDKVRVPWSGAHRVVHSPPVVDR